MTEIKATVNQIPVLTWNWLKINRASVDESLEIKETSEKGTVSKLPQGITYLRDAEKEAMSVPDLETALGKQFSPILQEHGTIPQVLKISENTKAEKPVYISYNLKDRQCTFEELVIIAEDNSEATVIIDFSSPKDASGLNAIQTKIHAGKNAKLHLVTVQLLGNNFIHLNDIGTRGDESSLIDVTQIELGAKKMYTGVYSTLNTFNAQFKNDVSYFLRGDQELDMNYVAVQQGKKTDSSMTVNGTLRDNAKKTYRGTIDFKNGCKGSTGNEQEETLLLSPTVVNKSIPLILCDEEDVAGEHGATIGRLDESILFYMNSHGISKEGAEQIMTRAKVMRTAELIKDEETVKKISDYLDEVFDE